MWQVNFKVYVGTFRNKNSDAKKTPFLLSLVMNGQWCRNMVGHRVGPNVKIKAKNTKS